MSQRSDQASDRVSYSADPPPAPSTAFTATFWVRLRVDRDDFSTMMRLHSSSGSSTTVTMTTTSSGATPIVASAGNPSGISGTDVLVVDEWRMIAVTIAGTGATDGTMYTRVVGGSTNVSTGEVSGGSTPTGLTLFGRSASDATEWFNGGLAYVRIWSAVLSQAEIEAEWASATTVRTTDLWADWPLLTDINDVSGNGRHLTAGSTSLTTEDDPPIAGSGTVTGTAIADFGGLTATASGVRTVTGTPSIDLGGLTISATGLRIVTGSAAGDMGGLTAAASSPSLITGTASAVFGTLTAVASGSVPTAAPQGSWYGLTSIIREAIDLYTEERSRTPEACPDCGEPLRPGPRGELFCPFDGSMWAAGNRRVNHFRN